MSSEKSLEVVGCSASIMKNVWEIRMREYGQRIKLEQERIQRSALPLINKDWANRMVAKLVLYKRVEKKIKPAEIQPDNNVWKSKQPQVPPAPPRGTGLSPPSRPGIQRTGFSTAVPKPKGKKVHDRTSSRLQLLMFLTQTEPSALVWGKSWKYNKSLPSPAEGSTDWGQCWMFATQQPCSEAGESWPNEPNAINPHDLHLWVKSEYRTVESQQLNWSFPTEEWQISWKKSNKDDTYSTNGENIPKSGLFTLLLEIEHKNEALRSSEWNDSWRSTKPTIQQDPFSVPDNDLLNESMSSKHDKDQGRSLKWEECWRFVNHHACDKSKVQPKKSHSPEWANSWRAATVVFNSPKNLNLSLRKANDLSFDDQNQQKESCFHKITPVPHEHQDKHPHLLLCNEFKAASEWSKSWQVAKNNSEPCEEIVKVLKALPSRAEPTLEAQRVKNNPKEHFSKLEEADPCYKQLKHDIIYKPKKALCQSKLVLLKQLENILPFSELRDSWKMIQHRMRLEKRKMRTNLLNPLRDSEKKYDVKPVGTEWKDSWKSTCQPVNQEPDLWQQGWSTTVQMRVNRAGHQTQFVPVDLPKNEETGKWSLRESWKFSRHRHRSGPGKEEARISQKSVTSHQPENSWSQGRNVTSILDWQAAWMVSEAQFHHDKPSLTQWRDAWKFSIYHTHWNDQVPRENCVDESIVIQPLKRNISFQKVKDKMSRSFDSLTFRERYPENEWRPSWCAASLFSSQRDHYGSSEIIRQSDQIQQQHASESEHGSKWGRSFRLANPMPQLEQPWLESLPNHCHYSFMWSRGKKIQNSITNNNHATFSLWENSCQFLQSAQIQKGRKMKGPTDPRVIITKKNKTRQRLYDNTDKEKQSEKKWAGCHLLGKTQPRPRKGAKSVIKLNPEEKTNEKFLEEWAESWRFLVDPDSLKKQMPFKSLSGWDESWKFLVPPYQPLNDSKAK